VNFDDDLRAALMVFEEQAPDADQVLSGVPRQARARRRRKAMLVTGGVSAAAAAATVSGLMVPKALAPTASAPTAGAPSHRVAAPSAAVRPSQPRPAASDAAALRTALLTAYAHADGSIAYTHLVASQGGQPASDVQVWSYPARPKPGQLVRVRMLIKGFRDTEVSFVLPPAGSSTVTVQAIDVGYGNRTWSQGQDVKLAFTGLLADPTWEIRPNLTDGKYHVVRQVKLGGRTLIETFVPDSRAPRSVSTVWIDARTHLPVTSPIDLPARHGSPAAKVYFFNTTAYFGYLPPTSKNLAALRPAVPAGFTRTAMGALPKDLGGNPTTPASS
jgi:hypothetical protein